MNNYLFTLIHSYVFQYQWLDSLVWFFAVPFIYIMIAVVAIFLFWHYKIFEIKNTAMLIQGKGREIISIFFSAGFAYGIACLLKILIHTDRPFIALSNITILFTETGYAFPSAHSTLIAALAFAVYFKHKRLGYICFIAALLIGIARIAAGVHFPIDIVGGYVLGFIVAFFIKRL